MIYNIDYEWLITEIKNKNPKDIIEILNYTSEIIKLDTTIENWDTINKIVDIACRLDKELTDIVEKKQKVTYTHFNLLREIEKNYGSFIYYNNLKNSFINNL